MDILGRHEKPLNAPVTMNLQFASLISEYLKMQMWKWGARLRVSHPHEAPCGVRWRSRNDGDIHDCLPYVCGQFRRNVNSRVLKQMIERYNLHRKVDFGRDSVHGGHFSRTRAVEIFRHSLTHGALQRAIHPKISGIRTGTTNAVNTPLSPIPRPANAPISSLT